MPRAYDRRQLVVDRDPLRQLVPDPGKLPKLDPREFYDGFLRGIKLLTGIDLSSPEALVVSIIELLKDRIGGGALDPAELLAIVGKILGFAGTPTSVDELAAWASGALFGLVNPGRLPVIPVSQIGHLVTSLLPNGMFGGASSIIDPFGRWLFDARDGGSARATADGTVKELHSTDLITVTPGQVLDVVGKVMWSGLAAIGSPIELGLTAYSDTLGENVAGRPSIARPAGQTGTVGWKDLTGSYTVPQEGVKAVRVRVTVGSDATAGDVWFRGVDAFKSGLLPIGLVDNLSARLAALLGVDVWQSFLDAAKGAAGGQISDLINRIVHLGVNGTFDASQLVNVPNMPTLPGTKVGGITGGNILQDISRHVDNVVNKFLGMTGSGHALDDAAAAMGTIYSQVRTSAQQLQDMIASQAGDAHSGKSFRISFNEYPNGAFPEVFDMTYSGSGSGYAEVRDGKGTWHKVADGDREVMGKHSGDTLTDYQAISGTVASPMDNGARNWLFGRCNAAKTTFVYAFGTRNSLLDFRAELGCFVNGVKYVFRSNVQANPNFNLALKIGTGKGLRNFQVISGNEVIIDYTDTAGVSQVGENFRGWGFISSTSNNGNNVPAEAVLITCADSDPAAAIGSGAKMSRTSTARVSVTSGRRVFPVNFYQSLDLATPDILPDVPNGRFTVALSGWYRVEIGFRTTPSAFAFMWNFAPVLFRNGGVERIGTDAYAFYYFGVGAGARFAQTSFGVYLNAGDDVQAGYDAGGNYNNLIQGEASGVETYFSISLLNRSLG
ncbi:minor tail protein [Mycobacterium phage ZoeJ]|uniref:Minor tail protein n=1 Tax=Mycobacterium phage ZoeJ TaxID=1486427 RepID=A0A023W6U8_9CAUD|nr:minor tail protein [Mycobacterium phage ZoeJ]AHY26847.1 minor tail protein [Mycobacterium phage ZoeJ]